MVHKGLPNWGAKLGNWGLVSKKWGPNEFLEGAWAAQKQLLFFYA
jgi:hypothetical protein